MSDPGALMRIEALERRVAKLEARLNDLDGAIPLDMEPGLYWVRPEAGCAWEIGELRRRDGNAWWSPVNPEESWNPTVSVPAEIGPRIEPPA